MGSDSKMNEDYVLARFDRLVEEGTVVYNEDYRTVTVLDQGLPVRPTLSSPLTELCLTLFQFEFRILKSHTTKPQAPREPQKPSSSQQPGCRPGGDIGVAGFEMATLGSTHLLMANKFPAARPHLLILTQDGFRRQWEALDIDDLTAAHQGISSLSSRHLLLFNCGIDGGCSRLHKHMQLIPAPDPDKFTLWLDAEEPQLPFKFFIHRFRDGLPPPDKLLGIYEALLRRAERAVDHAALEGETAIPHNVIMDRKWLVVIPRRSGSWDDIGANAASMLGMVWVQNEETMDIWLERGPANVLARLGVPVDAS
jgi:ATP adenylyltransferase